MIYNDDPGEFDKYPIFLLSYINHSGVPNDLISNPRKIKTDYGHIAYVFAICGMLYNFIVCSNDHKIPAYILKNVIQKNNEMNIIEVPKEQAWDFILGKWLK